MGFNPGFKGLNSSFLPTPTDKRLTDFNARFIQLYLSNHSELDIYLLFCSNPGAGEIFRTCPELPWGPPSLLYNGYRVFLRGKERPGRDADPSPLSSAVGQERV